MHNKFERQLQGRKKRRWWLWGFLAVLCVTSGLVAAWLFMPTGKGTDGKPRNVAGEIRSFWVGRNPELIFEGRSRVNVVFLGCDRNYDDHGRLMDTLGRADTILVISLEKATQEATLVSIPRDTLVRIPRHGAQKINAAYANGGPTLMLETLRESLGIEVHHYLVFKFEGFKRIVDAVGGVELDVPKDMDYEDHWANLSIHLKKGWQHLDGAKAHGFVRFRHDTMGDVGRIERQQMLAKALAQKMKNPSTWKHMPRLLQTLRECVETDLSEDQLASLALFSKGIDTNSFKTEVLPAEWFSPYMIIQPNNAEELLTRVFGFTFDKTSWEIHLIAQAPPSYHHDDHDRPVRHPKKKSKRSRRSRKTVSSEAASEAAPPESDASAGSAESAPADPTPSGGGDQPSSSDDSG